MGRGPRRQICIPGHPDVASAHAAARRVKLTTTSVAVIRKLYERGTTQVTLAKQFGISQSNVSDIVRKNIWAA